MGDDLIKIFRLPFNLFWWLFKSFVTIFVTLLLIILLLIGKGDIAEIVENFFSGFTSGSERVTTQVLIPDSHNIEYILHTVQTGDTITKLAQRYRIDAKTIIEMNNINNYNSIYPGKILFIPQYSRSFPNIPQARNKKAPIVFM